MIFRFKNIGTVESADIELKGITVLTGLNDTGKSFLGKSIFSILKTIQEAQRFYAGEKYQIIHSLFNQIQQQHRQLITFTQDKILKFNTTPLIQKVINYYFAPQVLGSEIELIKAVEDYASLVRQDLELARLVLNTSSKIDSHRLQPQPKSFDDAIAKIWEFKREVLIHLSEKRSDEDKYKNYFDKRIIQRLYQSQINSLFVHKNLEVEVEDGETKLLSVIVEDNVTKKFTVENEFFLIDATIIETPTIIQFDSFITNALAFPGVGLGNGQDRNDLPFHYQDLVQKIKIGTATINPLFSEINNKIKEIISGEFKINREDGGIGFYKKNGNKVMLVRPNNIATGVKSLGLFQLLLNANIVAPNSLLIFDEPEVHLHPDWEIKYAEIFVLLAQFKIPILLSTHSPYFIQAIYKYSEKYFKEEYTSMLKVYFGKKNIGAGISKFSDVSNDPDPIFEALGSPMRKISI